MSNSLWPHGLQHARPPCPSPTPGVSSNSCPLSWWCHPTISSSVVPSLLSIFPSIRVFSNESVLHIRWPKYCQSKVKTQLIQLLCISFKGNFSSNSAANGLGHVFQILKIQIWVESGEKSCPQLGQSKIIRARFPYNLAVSLFRSNVLWAGLASVCHVTVWISKSPFFWTLHNVQVKWKSLSRVRLFVTPWTIQPMEFSRPECWSG